MHERNATKKNDIWPKRVICVHVRREKKDVAFVKQRALKLTENWRIHPRTCYGMLNSLLQCSYDRWCECCWFCWRIFSSSVAVALALVRSPNFSLSLLCSVNIVIIDRKLFSSIKTFNDKKHHCPNNNNSFLKFCVELVLEFLLIHTLFPSTTFAWNVLYSVCFCMVHTNENCLAKFST